ncbi:hypothetical protein AVEN_270689-1 [Araneus ventricosus]|uniref:Uncharacterized protein n=1 Tax=Araneus ventricosus TaxID=182803 RepID=A0A4Y2FYB6_ARAVE|nr:hypothetical protein AVEN_270689-1 [Araneus ventricosus]
MLRLWGLLHVKSYVVVKRSSSDVVRKFGEDFPAQVPSSSPDHGSKLRGQSQNSPRVSSKRDTNVPSSGRFSKCHDTYRVFVSGSKCRKTSQDITADSGTEVSNLWYPYSWGYAKDLLGIGEIKVVNGGNKRT